MDRYTDLLYNIALTALCGNNPRRMEQYIKLFDSPEAVFRARIADPRWIRIRSTKSGMTRQKAIALAERTLENCEESGIGVILLDDAAYPQRLKNIPDPPRVLYVRGTMPDMNALLGISIVGTRRATNDASELTHAIAYDLADKGAVIISGMAKGIDGAAHRGALDAGGTTIAVLAGGVDRIYPKEHTKLYHEILEQGAVISEQPPGIIGRAEFYQARNRIIVGLSFGVLFAEGEDRSGTSISLRHAEGFGRDVFAIPGSPMAPQSELPNKILRDGAIVTRSADDILEEYWNYETLLENGRQLKTKPLTERPQITRAVKKQEKTKPVKTEGKPEEQPTPKKPKINLELFSEPERMILEYLCQSNETVHIDDIIANCGIEAAKAGGLLTLLEMKGVIRQYAGSRYSLAE